jgi:hypothetical protein
LSAYEDSGATKLTALLRDRAGADKYHQTVDTTGYSVAEKDWVEEEEKMRTASNMYFTISVDGYGTLKDFGNAVGANVFENSSWGKFNTDIVLDVTLAPYTWDPNGWGLKTSYNGEYTTEASSMKLTLNLKQNEWSNNISKTKSLANKEVTITFSDGIGTLVGTTDENGTVTFDFENYYTEQIPSHEDGYTVSGTSSIYTVYKTEDDVELPSSVYFMTNLSYKSDVTKYKTYKSDYEAIRNNDAKYWLELSSQYIAPGFTDTILTGLEYSSATEDSDMYEYAEINWKEASSWDMSAATTKASTKYATDRATKNNEAIVTMFPYTLADEMYIGGTHPQTYAVDVDDDDVTVLYSLAAGTSSHSQTSVFAADPGDGTDNYFMYTRKNIYYCSAGHGKITGLQKDNLNERYLYMNIICNSVRQSAIAPTIGVYDDTSTENSLTNNVVQKQSDGSYEMTIDDDAKYPSFSFKVGVDDNAELKKVEIYYDLDYGKTIEEKDSNGNVVKNSDGSVSMVVNDSDDYDSTSDVMIASWGVEGNKNTDFTADLLGHICDDVADTKHSSSSKHGSTDLLESYSVKNLVTKVTDNLSALYLRTGDTTTYGDAEPDYFAAYDGNYTYIVIKATSVVTINGESTKKVTYKRIKITRKDHLFNLT